MKRYFIILILIVFFIGIFVGYGCRAKVDRGEIAAEVNGYVMTVDDFNEELKYAPRTADGSADKERVMDLAIKKQILIQEAQRQGLDRKKSFMEAIERYWQQTLIKELLEKENQKINATQKDPEKSELELNRWMNGLYKQSKIKIYWENIEKTEN